MKRCLFVLIPFLLSSMFSILHADQGYQSDWSGGPGVWGPVSSWEIDFYYGPEANWSTSPGTITIAQSGWEHIVDDEFDGARYVFAADIDDDGDMDLLGAAALANEITWWENVGGTGTSWIEHTVDDQYAGANCVCSEDIDNDGDMDILATASADSLITWWENTDGEGTSWMKHIIDDAFVGALSVFPADIDDDGFMDVVGAAAIDNKITWWENVDGTGTSWIEHPVDDFFDGAYCVYVKDMDNDGDMDILGAARFADRICWWENSDGTGKVWTEHLVDGTLDFAFAVYSEDIDGDGDNDILGSARYDGDVIWWENLNAAGTSWNEHYIDQNFRGASGIFAADLDDDGDIDVLGASEYDDQVSWWENNNGSGTTWTEHIVDDYLHDTNSVYAEDMNNDGKVDVICGGYAANDITWWDLTAYSPNCLLESSILNTGTEPTWNSIEWNATEPPNTSVSFQVRASDNYVNMGDWSGTLASPCALAGILTDGDRFVQYRAILNTTDPDATPLLSDITISWNPLGIEGGPQPTDYLLLGAEPNPARGMVQIGFAVPEISPVELSIFDLAGHLVITPAGPAGEMYSQGIHLVQIEDITPGIYFCRMISGEFSASQRFVVIE